MSTFDDMVSFLDLAYKAKDQIVPCLIGPVGIGKTAAVEQHAKNVGANKVVTIIASQILPNEVSGITMPDSKTKAMEIYDHFRLSSLEDEDILFFDELLEADQLVLSACLTLIESRSLMSGRKLPDIQIIAATNPTINPITLKENIRQRFVFRRFSIDPKGCRDYLCDTYGITVPSSILDSLVESSKDYNILSQRSLTKMVHWLMQADNDDEAHDIALQINIIWASDLGKQLFEARHAMLDKKEKEESESFAKDRIADILEEHEIFTDDINDMSFSEILDKLTSLSDWPEIKQKLDDMDMAMKNEENPEDKE